MPRIFGGVTDPTHLAYGLPTHHNTTENSRIGNDMAMLQQQSKRCVGGNLLARIAGHRLQRSKNRATRIGLWPTSSPHDPIAPLRLPISIAITCPTYVSKNKGVALRATCHRRVTMSLALQIFPAMKVALPTWSVLLTSLKAIIQKCHDRHSWHDPFGISPKTSPAGNRRQWRRSKWSFRSGSNRCGPAARRQDRTTK